MKSGVGKFSTKKKQILSLDLNFWDAIVFLVWQQKQNYSKNVDSPYSHISLNIMEVGKRNFDFGKLEDCSPILTLHGSPAVDHMYRFTEFLSC